ncbi:MAG: GNAT family N-acetyltransferase [Ruminococcaceae bacterium]|nr:GNAT family N-acetyltransferase [Oscillospiraceae bacterium]
MKKVIVIGCPGSGKTTFSEKLNKYTGLPLYYLDAIWHKPDKTHVPREEFDERIKEIFSTDEWIIDGNYNRTIETRLQYCDTVFLFDLPTEVCIQGATERLGKGRYDLPWIEKELDPEFEGFIKEFSEKALPKIYNLIEKYKAAKQVIIFKSREEADEYLSNQIWLNDIEFQYLNKLDFSVVANEIFNILAVNMEKIAPTGNTREEDYRCWYEGVSNGLKRDERQIVLIKDSESIIGFFQYYINEDTFMMEEIQLKPEYHGKGVFRKLYGFMIESIRGDLEFVEAYANTENHKSIEILEKLGLSKIGMNKSGSCFHFKGKYAGLKEWYKKQI